MRPKKSPLYTLLRSARYVIIIKVYFIRYFRSYSLLNCYYFSFFFLFVLFACSFLFARCALFEIRSLTRSINKIK